ncbi:hypothetical protein [Paraclostridium sordellii]
MKTGKLIADEDCKKFGRDWVIVKKFGRGLLVKESAMVREYGEKKE